jgi:hypothetical protein
VTGYRVATPSAILPIRNPVPDSAGKYNSERTKTLKDITKSLLLD